MRVLAQVIGTFQSTHQAPPQSVYNLLNSAPYQAVFVAKGQNIPQRYAFSHQTITQQLQSGALLHHGRCLINWQGLQEQYSTCNDCLLVLVCACVCVWERLHAAGMKQLHV